MTALRAAPFLTLLFMIGPLLAGLIGTILPAFGYLPALGGNTFSLGPFQAFFAMPGIGRSIATSLLAGLAATALALGVVFLFLAAAGSRAIARAQSALAPLLSVPHAAAAFGLAFLIAPSGFLSRLASPWLTGWDRPPDALIIHDPMAITMTLGLAAKEVPFLLLVTLAAMPQVPVERTRQVMSTLGYGRIAGFALAVWPQLYAQIRLAVFAVLAFSTSVVDVALILGPTIPELLSARLVRLMSDPDLTLRFAAAAGALVQLGVTLSAMLFWIAGERIGAALLRMSGQRGQRATRDAGFRLLGMANAALVGFALFGGIVALVLWSISGPWSFPSTLPRSFTLSGWSRLMDGAVPALWTTLVCGLIASLVATLLVAGCLAREDEVIRLSGARSQLVRRSLFLVYLPLLVPQASFLFGLQFLFITFGADGTMVALVAAHLVFVLPYVFLSLSDPWRAMDPRYAHAGQALGLSPFRVLLRIRLPMMLAPILAAFALGFAVSCGQYLATVLVGAGRLTTIATEAVALASGGNRRVIATYALTQMILPALVFGFAIALPAFYFRNRRAMRV